MTCLGCKKKNEKPNIQKRITHTCTSPDKTKTAIVKYIFKDDKVIHQIHINDKLEYTVPYQVVHCIRWIDEDTLAWSCFNQGELTGIDKNGIRYFENGADITHQSNCKTIRILRPKN